jgi:hypothetical protein
VEAFQLSAGVSETPVAALDGEIRTGAAGALEGATMVRSSTPASGAPPPDAVAWLVTCAGALVDTFTVTAIVEADPPLKLLVLVQLPLPQFHPEPDMLASVSPAGRISATVTVPLGPAPRALLTVKV